MDRRTLTTLLSGLMMAFVAQASEKPHWSYAGEGAPQHWGSLSPDYSVCASGRNQSPINLTGMLDADLAELQIDYPKTADEIVNNGHSIQVNVQPGDSLTVGGHRYALKQFHFHSPSENTIEGESFPLEAHFVHADEAGNLAVIAVMYRNGAANAELAKAWSQMPAQAGDKARLSAPVDPGVLLPENHDYYRFNGSLTTPPCSEGVAWYVIKQIDSASEEQIEHFAHTMHHDNNRPLQPLNARLIIE
ncbi:MAG: carbonic anhydrase family protein [Candidatus Thiodiazotropha sp.]